MSASPSLVALAKTYESTRKRAPRSVADLPRSTPQAEAFAKQLKSQGYRFVGPTSCVRVHAERRRGQRPHPWVLPRVRLPQDDPEPLTIAILHGSDRRSGSWWWSSGWDLADFEEVEAEGFEFSAYAISSYTGCWKNPCAE
jgi:hypothetical protein